MIQYLIEGQVSRVHKDMPIDETQFVNITAKRKYLIEIHYIEEKFELILGNFMELEQSLLYTAAEHMVYGPRTRKWYYVQKQIIIRKLINYLSTCRLYIDQTKHHLNNIYGRSNSITRSFESYTNNEYDSCPGYRIMDALRNYTQHRGYPFHLMSFPVNVVDIEKRDKILFSVTPLIQPDIMQKDGGVKISILNELIRMGPKIDVKPLFREYMEALWRIHSSLRDKLRDDIESWDKVVIDAFRMFYETNDISKKHAISLIKKSKPDTIEDAIYLPYDIITERKYYEKRNRNLNSISKRYVSGEVLKSNV